MKTLNLYYVYDTINETSVTGPIPVNNHLTAAIGFRDSYIKNKKSPYNYQQLQLVYFGFLNVDENGEFSINTQSVEIKRLSGKEVMEYISSELKARGIDDLFDEEEVEGK